MSRIAWTLVSVALALVIFAAIVATVGFRYAYEPSVDNVLSRRRPSPEAYDLWGQAITRQKADELSPGAGVVKVDDALLQLGRKSFYKETFGNEVYLTDVLGILAGPLRISNVAEAVLALKGGSTTNLRVKVPETVTIGGRTFAKGSYFDTGLDVAKGSLVPLGMSVSVSGWRVRVGITCAACHATVDPQTGKVVEGAPNNDLNAGLLLALATNSGAYFMHTDVHPLTDVPASATTVKTSNGQTEHLPDPLRLEESVDTALLMWPRGNFDSLTDGKADPTQNPISFTWGNHPYGWSGNFMAGPFHGLTAQNNNVHALNSDALLLAGSSRALLDMDKQIFLAIELQRAASKRFRYDPATGRTPSEFLASVSPNPSGPGVNQVVLPPTYPKGTLLSPDGTLTSSPGYDVWQQNNAMAAFQDTIMPPAAAPISAVIARHGREIFERAGCAACHSGSFLTDNKIVPAAVIGANPVRARALEKTQLNFAPPVLFAFDTPVPLPTHPQTVPVPTDNLDPEQIRLGWAHDGSPGGYKTATLIGLAWSAPYLHDGGVAVGKGLGQIGLPGTVEQNILPDPSNSLLALIDRSLRSKVVAANAASPALQRMNVQGIGHNFWIDADSGFNGDDQQALIAYLLAYEPPH